MWCFCRRRRRATHGVVGVTPAAFAFGNGPGVPGTFILVGVLYLLSRGFTTMIASSPAPAACIPISSGLAPVGVAGALIALATYNAIDIAVYACSASSPMPS